MSALLMLLYWVVIPIGGFKLASWLFRRTKSLVIKGLVIFGTLVLYIWFLWIAVGRNMWLDHQVREMCAKDGGIKVYETVELPRERFDKYGNYHISPCGFTKPKDKYCLESKDHYYLRGNPVSTGSPDFFQSIYRVIRQSDGKVLGERSSFIRRGGGLPGPWHLTSFSCPGRISLVKSIFIMEKNDEHNR